MASSTSECHNVGAVVQPGANVMGHRFRSTIRCGGRADPTSGYRLHPSQSGRGWSRFPHMIRRLMALLRARLSASAPIPSSMTRRKNRSARRPLYRVMVRTDRNYLGTTEHPLPIIPGMVARSRFLTGEKSVLDYLNQASTHPPRRSSARSIEVNVCCLMERQFHLINFDPPRNPRLTALSIWPRPGRDLTQPKRRSLNLRPDNSSDADRRTDVDGRSRRGDVTIDTAFESAETCLACAYFGHYSFGRCLHDFAIVCWRLCRHCRRF